MLNSQIKNLMNSKTHILEDQNLYDCSLKTDCIKIYLNSGKSVRLKR